VAPEIVLKVDYLFLQFYYTYVYLYIYQFWSELIEK